MQKGKITQDMIMLLDKWRHAGFNVFFGPRILPRQEKSMASGSQSLRLGEKPWPGELVRRRRIIRASFSQQRMNYHRETGQVQYRPKDGKETKVFDALEWLAAMCSHVPNKGEQMARYYGFYSQDRRRR